MRTLRFNPWFFTLSAILGVTACSDILGYKFGDYKGPGGSAGSGGGPHGGAGGSEPTGGAGGDTGGAGGSLPTAAEFGPAVLVNPLQQKGSVRAAAPGPLGDGSFFFAGLGGGEFLEQTTHDAGMLLSVKGTVPTLKKALISTDVNPNDAISPEVSFLDMVVYSDEDIFLTGHYSGSLSVTPQLDTSVLEAPLMVHWNGNAYTSVAAPHNEYGLVDAAVAVSNGFVVAGVYYDNASNSPLRYLALYSKSGQLLQNRTLGPSCYGYIPSNEDTIALTVDDQDRVWLLSQTCHNIMVDGLQLPAPQSNQSAAFGLVFEIQNGTSLAAVAAKEWSVGLAFTSAAPGNDHEVVAVGEFKFQADLDQCGPYLADNGADLLLSRLVVNGLSIMCVTAKRLGSQADERAKRIVRANGQAGILMVGSVEATTFTNPVQGDIGFGPIFIDTASREVGYVARYDYDNFTPRWYLYAGDTGRVELTVVNTGLGKQWVAGFVGESPEAASANVGGVDIDWPQGTGFGQSFVAEVIEH
ncbi:MAG: hypothetical protein U0271_14240 [Polyangiaceae bacterium]